MNSHPVEDVEAQVRAGQIEQAIALATAALADTTRTPDQRMALLEQRCECHVMRVEFRQAEADVQAMAALARSHKTPALQALASIAAARVFASTGRSQDAVKAAQAALKAARQSGQQLLQARALQHLSDALYHGGTDIALALEHAQQAYAQFERLGDFKGQAQALCSQFYVLSATGRAAEADSAAQRMLRLAQQAGARSEEARALGLLTFHQADLAAALSLYRQALAINESAGNLGGRANAIGNMGALYAELGLDRHARRLCEAVRGQLGAEGNLFNLWNLFESELDLGDIAAARTIAAEATALLHVLKLRRHVGVVPYQAGRILACEGQWNDAAHLLEQAANGYGADHVGMTMTALAYAAQSRLAAGQAGAALKATRRGTDLHISAGLSTQNGGESVMLWWQHCLALRANGRLAEAHQALKQAWQCVLDATLGLSDEGLRRNALNKMSGNAAVVQAWVADGRARGLPLEQVQAHLRGEASLKEPFARLVDTGMRLNEIKTEAELREFLVDEVTELSGAQRVLLVLQGTAAQGSSPTLEIAGSLVPRGESDADLLAAITPWLHEAGRTRTATLRHGPEGADPLDQRSCLIVPLIAQRELLGFVYADLEGVFGRFHKGDKQLLAMLAAQAAVSLANVRAAEVLERKVLERTAEARAAQAQAEQRAAELAVINGVQAALAAERNMQGIYEAVGDKMREVYGSGDLDIRIIDEQAGLLHMPYAYDQGERLAVPAIPIPDAGMTAHVCRTRETLVINEDMVGAVARFGGGVVPGTPEYEKSAIYVPMVWAGKVHGLLCVSNYEREHAFHASDVRLLQTLANSMSVALQSAQLFEENQRRARESAALTEVGREISATLDLDQLMDRIARHAKELLGGDNSAIYLPAEGRGDDAGAYRAIVAMGDMQAQLQDTVVVSGQGMIGDIIAKGRGEFINDTSIDARAVQIDGTDDVNDERLLVEPLISGRDVKGAIAVWRSGGTPFNKSDLEFLQGLAMAASVAMQNARLFNETQRLLSKTERRAAELATVNTVSQQLAAKLDVDALIALVGAEVRNVFKADLASVALLDRTTNMIHFPYAYGEDSPPLAYGEGITSKIIGAGEALVLNSDVGARSAAMGAELIGVQAMSYMGVPIVVNGRSEGVISVQSTQREGAFDADDQRLLTTIAANVGVALQNAQLFNEVQAARDAAETVALAKSRFLAAASHDLRQPMYALNLYLGALGRYDLPDAAHPTLASARECAKTMDEMFGALLDISKLDASVMQASISTFAIAPLLEKIKSGFVQQAHAKGLELRVAPCSAFVSSDPELLERVLANLVSNAVHYTERGKVLIGCRRTALGLRIGVYDTGPGIAADQQRAVFEEFYQVGNPERDRAQGLGLGLAIVQRVGTLLKAPLALSSQVGKGSAFSIELPCAEPTVFAPPEAVFALRGSHATLRGALIAVIDDEPLILDATALVLRQCGSTVVTATSGAEAIDRLSQCGRVPDAIVCDHRLRGTETGVDVIAALRVEFNSDIPAVLVTGDTSPQRIQSMATTGIPVLNKPLQDHVLMDALLRLLNRLPMA